MLVYQRVHQIPCPFNHPKRFPTLNPSTNPGCRGALEPWVFPTKVTAGTPWYPKMDGEHFHGKPLIETDDFGRPIPFSFGNTFTWYFCHF